MVEQSSKRTIKIKQLSGPEIRLSVDPDVSIKTNVVR